MQNFSETEYADVPVLNPEAESVKQHATLDALDDDITAALGGGDAAAALAGGIIADLETRIDAGLGITPSGDANPAVGA